LLKSMTAYGAGEFGSESRVFSVEIRSYNNRYRDVVLRLPRDLQPLEQDLKALIASRIRRGRAEVSVQVAEAGDEAAYDLELNRPLVRSYLEIFGQLAEQAGIDPEVRMEVLCQMRDVILVKPRTVEADAARAGIEEALGRALDSLDAMRVREGAAIEADFIKRIDLIEGYAGEIRKRAPAVVAAYQERLKEKIARLGADTAVDEGRLAQEIAFFADRSDITEELVRIESHLEQFRGYLPRDEALGRRLDFLLQEINREVNTIGSKASDAVISATVVEMKAELEKLREQVQNVE